MNNAGCSKHQFRINFPGEAGRLDSTGISYPIFRWNFALLRSQGKEALPHQTRAWSDLHGPTVPLGNNGLNKSFEIQDQRTLCRDKAHDVNVAMESRNSWAARLKSRVANKKMASYTFSLFFRSQSPPSAISSWALFSLSFNSLHSPAAMCIL